MPMMMDEYRAALEALGLTVTGKHSAESFLGVGERTARGWAAGRTPVPDAVAMLLRLMIRRKMKPATVRLNYGQ